MIKNEDRSKLIINKKFQFKLIFWMMSVALAPILVFYGAHKYFFWQLSKIGTEIKLPSDHIYFKFLSIQDKKLLYIFIISSVIIAFIVFLLGLFLSHRIAGPIHHLKEHLKKVIDGNQSSPLVFREDDFFQELPGLINECVTKVNSSKDKK